MPRELRVDIVGDVSGLSKAYDEAGTKTESLGSKFGGLAKAAALGAGAAGVGALVVAFKGVIDKAKEAEKAQAEMVAALESVGVSYKAHADVIDDTIQKTSKLAAIDDEDLQGAFTKLVRSSGDVTKSLEGMNLAADISRARHISLEAATKTVEKAMLGNEDAFKKVGLAVKDGTTATEAFEQAQKKFAGSAQAYGETAAGAQEKLGIAIENLQEKIGAKLLPVVTKMSEKLLDFVNWAEKNGPAFKEALQPGIEAVEKAFTLLKDAIDKVMPLIKLDLKIAVVAIKAQMELWKAAINLVEGAIKLLDKALDALKPVMTGVKNTAKIVADFFTDTFNTAFDAGKKAVAGVDTALDGVRKAINLVKPVASVFADWIEGPFKLAWNTGKTAVAAVDKAIDGVGSALKAVKTAGEKIGDYLAGAWTKMWDLASTAVAPLKIALDGIKAALGAIERAAGRVADAIRAIPTPHLPDLPGVPFLASGGIVTGPTLAMIGEGGPEAVVPLDRLGGGGGGLGGVTVNLTVNGHVWDKRDLVEEIRGALVRTRLAMGASGV